MPVDVLVLYTGGKDSHYAALRAVEEGHVIKCLVTAAPRRHDSYMFHTVNVMWASLHGEAMGVPHHFVEVSGEREVEVEELAEALRYAARDCGVEAVVTGAVASRYQRERVDKIAGRLGLRHVAPLWGRGQEELLLEEAARLGFIIVAAMAMGLGRGWLGARVGPAEARRLVELSRLYGFSPVGEGGEYETYVVESPLFRGRRVEVVEGDVVWSEAGWGYYVIKKARLV
ncbi:diphthine--ammonia ligase [Pyrobaculum sp.]|uniref:diphthine--ammonia ligase n=1 Tax=Pyrobaculum sp. TaxID=2004705 RepID=UPI003D0EA55C